jgi:uncharacterized membrane protein
MWGKSGNSKGFDVRAAIFMASLAMMAACADTGSKADENAQSAEKASLRTPRIGHREVTEEPPPSAPPIVAAGGCRTQDGGELPRTRLRAVGTEPFWGAEVDGRCVNYTTPENQVGTRVWTHYDASANRWEGALDTRSFKLTIKTHEGCSDGMSDRSYPLVAIVEVGGEERRGCAEIL